MAVLRVGTLILYCCPNGGDGDGDVDGDDDHHDFD